MAETNSISGNGTSRATVPPTSSTSAPASSVQATPSTTSTGQTEKFQIKLPGQESSEKEAKKQSAFSFLQNLLKKEKPGAAATVSSPATPAAAPVVTSPVSPEENVYSKLFGKNQGGGIAPPSSLPSPASQSSSSLPSPLAKIMSARPLLAKAPTLDEFSERRKVIRAKRLFYTIFFLAVLFIGFIYLQRNPNIDLFGKTIAKKFDETNQAVIALQTEINEARLRLILLHLNRVNLYGDSFLFNRGVANSPHSNSNEKLLAKTKTFTQRKEIERSLSVIKEALSKPFFVEIYSPENLSRTDLEKKFETALQETLQGKKSGLDAQKPEDAEELRVIGNLLQILENRAIRGFFKNIDITKLDDAGIEEVIRKIRERGSDDLSYVAQLKQKRIPWTEIIARIDEVTRRVDKVYGQGLFEDIGGVRYTNYDFNSKTGQVSLTGQVKTDDAKTFTLVADLIDAFEKSPYFKDIDMRDFSKSKSEKFGYGSSLRLQFSIQEPAEKDPRDSGFSL